MSTKRISKEYADITQDPPVGITATLPPSNSLHTWHVTIDGPSSTPYSDGHFGLVLTLPTDYPFKPPAVKFVTRIYHPNVTNDSLGNICLGLLKSENWKPSTKIFNVLEAVRQLLLEPNADDPLEESIAEEWRRDRAAFDKKAKDMTEKHATKQPEFPSS